MSSAITAPERPPLDSAEAHAFWRAAGLILVFNGLLVAWMLLKPGGDRVAASCSTRRRFVGPLLVLPLCFGGLLMPMWRRGDSRMDNQPTVMTGQRWAPIMLGLGIIAGFLRRCSSPTMIWCCTRHPRFPPSPMWAI